MYCPSHGDLQIAIVENIEVNFFLFFLNTNIQSSCQFTLKERNRVMMLTTFPNKATRLVSGCESTSELLFVIESWNYLNMLIIYFLVV